MEKFAAKARKHCSYKPRWGSHLSTLAYPWWLGNSSQVGQGTGRAGYFWEWCMWFYWEKGEHLLLTLLYAVTVEVEFNIFAGNNVLKIAREFIWKALWKKSFDDNLTLPCPTKIYNVQNSHVSPQTYPEIQNGGRSFGWEFSTLFIRTKIYAMWTESFEQNRRISKLYAR